MKTQTHQSITQKMLYHNLAIRDSYFFQHYLTHQIFNTQKKSVQGKKLLKQYLHHLWNSAASEKNLINFDHWLQTKTAQFCRHLSY